MPTVADAGAPVLVSVTPVMLSPLAVTRPVSVNAVLLKVATVPYVLLALLAVIVKAAGVTFSVPFDKVTV